MKFCQRTNLDSETAVTYLTDQILEHMDNQQMNGFRLHWPKEGFRPSWPELFVPEVRALWCQREKSHMIPQLPRISYTTSTIWTGLVTKPPHWVWCSTGIPAGTTASRYTHQWPVKLSQKHAHQYVCWWYSHLLLGCKPKGDKEGPTRRLRAGCNLDGNKSTGSEQRQSKDAIFGWRTVDRLWIASIEEPTAFENTTPYS